QRKISKFKEKQKKTPEKNLSESETEDMYEEKTKEQCPKWALKLFKNLNDSLQNKMENISMKIEQISQTLDSMKTKLQETEERMCEVENNVDKMKEDLEAKNIKILNLESKLDDFENRTCRNNLRFVGIKEGLEDQDLEGLVKRIFCEILEASDGNEIEIERDHRAPRPKPAPNEKPRHIIMKLLRWGDKEKILKKFRAKKGFTWEDQKIFVTEDFSQE
uniref:L1 transposable element RRM domain-containing protein n=1 Tax=Latimeria chalumnae TaxID=7897 RepID=H3A0R3_LATCH